MFRTVVIKNSSKLYSIHGYLVIFNGETEQKVLMDEISCLMVESYRTLISSPLLIELSRRNISVIFCDEKHNPCATLIGLNNYHSQLTSINTQINWNENTKAKLWQDIIKSKINMQANVLAMFNKDKSELLRQNATEVDLFDKDNKEGISARIFFSAMYGSSFTRNLESVINTLLDYGYAILMSCVNREIVSHGYLSQLGIFHKGQFNHFNLACDLMEPFRPIVDIIAYLNYNNENPKVEMRKLLTYRIKINNEERYLDNAISVYVNIVLNYLKEGKGNFPSIELLRKEEYESAGQSHENHSDV